MKLLFVTEARFVKNDLGYFSEDGVFSSKLWDRYLAVFDHVIICARVFPTQREFSVDEKLDCDNVSFVELPGYLGPIDFSRNIRKTYAILDKNIANGQACVFRVPGMLGGLASRVAMKKGISYAAEVVGDPDDVFAPGSFNHPFRFFFRWLFVKTLKFTLSKAKNVLYVTQSRLQEKYPAGPKAFTTYASNVFLDEIAYIDQGYIKKLQSKSINIISIGSLAQLYKSPDVLIKTINPLVERGICAHLTWLGDGKYKSDMIALSAKLGVLDRVNFVGNITPASRVRKFLDASDIFVLASRTEGLPRAMLEAMARGLPCIGTDVGGIPELLPQEMLVKKNVVSDLVYKIEDLVNHPALLQSQSKRNLNFSRQYASSILDDRRKEFYLNITHTTNENSTPH